MRGLILAVLLLAACAPMTTAPEPAPPAPSPQVSQPELPKTEAACKTSGGDWRPVCMMGRPACVVSYKDAGKDCRDGSECSSGRCYAKQVLATPPAGGTVGACAANSDPCGCRALVVKGQQTPVLCVD